MNLVLAITGASGVYAAECLLEKSPWPVTLLASKWGKAVCAHERGAYSELEKKAAESLNADDMWAPIASGSVMTRGMVILPASANTLAEIATGVSSSLITRAAHCHLKERRPLLICLREAPLSLIDCENMVKVTAAGATVLPLSPPFYMFGKTDPREVSMHDMLDAYVDRVLTCLGHPAERTWEDTQ